MSKSYIREASCVAISVALSSPIWAQDAVGQQGAESQQIADIVVTAQKRAENVQDVPISISAFGGDALQERGLSDVVSLANIAPSTSLDAGTPFSGSPAVLSAFIRGIGSNSFQINLDQGVGVYIDGVYLARSVGANVDFPDVERVEILKGPQGTLFGRNTIGGAISVVTRNPGKEFAVRGEVTTGRFNRLDAQASIDLPIVENLGSLVTFDVRNRDGFQKRIPYPAASAFVVDNNSLFPVTTLNTADREGGEHSWTLRGKLHYDVSGFRATLSGDYLRVNQSALNNNVLAIVPTAGTFAGLVSNNIPGTALDPTGQTGFNLLGLYNFCIGATPAAIAARNAQNLCGPRFTPLNPAGQLPGLGSVNVDGNPLNDKLPYDNRFLLTDIDKTYATGNSFSKIKSYGITGTLEKDLTDDLTIKSITAYRNLQFSSGLDADASPLQILDLVFSIDQEQFSQELQLTGRTLDNRLNYVFGAYYFWEDASGRNVANIDDALLYALTPLQQEVKNGAVYGQIDFKVSDLIGITLGGRYTEENKVLSAQTSDQNGITYKLFNCLPVGPACAGARGFPDPANPLIYFPPGEFQKKSSNFSPKFGINLHPADDILVYGTYSQGYKAGGFEFQANGPISVARSFDEEKAKTFEIGFKSRLLDRRMQINVAAYTTKYENIQLNFQIGATPTLQNAGAARIKGIEAEINTILAQGLTLDAALSYTHAEFTSVLGPAIVNPNAFRAGVFVGAALPKTPNWKINIRPRYEFGLVNDARIIAGVDYTYQSKTWNDTERTFLLQRPSTHMLQASLSYAAPNDRYRITVGGTNLLNERFITNGLSQLAGGLIYGSYSRPTEWYLKIGFNF